jgi:hypothetical protein
MLLNTVEVLKLYCYQSFVRKTNFTAKSVPFYFNYIVYLVVERLKFNDEVNNETKAPVTPTTAFSNSGNSSCHDGTVLYTPTSEL